MGNIENLPQKQRSKENKTNKLTTELKHTAKEKRREIRGGKNIYDGGRTMKNTVMLEKKISNMVPKLFGETPQNN